MTGVKRPVEWIAQDLRCILTEPNPMDVVEAIEAMTIIDEARALVSNDDVIALLKGIGTAGLPMPHKTCSPPSPATPVSVALILAGIFSGFVAGIFFTLFSIGAI